MAPFTPFFTEVLYQNMRKVSNGSEESIHYCSFPTEEGRVYILIIQYILSILQLVLLNDWKKKQCSLLLGLNSFNILYEVCKVIFAFNILIDN